MHDLLPLCTCSLALPWCSRVYAYDASPSGYGWGSSLWDRSLVATTGRLSERARFRGLTATVIGARQASFDEEEHIIRGSSAAALLQIGKDASFREVPTASEHSWAVSFAGCWKEKASQALRESKARTLTIRHIICSSHLHTSSCTASWRQHGCHLLGCEGQV